MGEDRRPWEPSGDAPARSQWQRRNELPSRGVPEVAPQSDEERLVQAIQDNLSVTTRRDGIIVARSLQEVLGGYL